MALAISGTVNDNQAGILRPRKTATPLIINGDMQIAQRGTSSTSVTGSGYRTVDRLRLAIANIGTWTITQETDAPDNTGLTKSYKVDCTTADASPASGDLMTAQYRIEGQNLQVLEKGTSDAQAVTLAFWVKSAKTGTYIVELYDSDNTRQISQSYTISSANTWEKKVMTFAGDTTGALGNDNGNSLAIQWWLGAGSDFTSGTLSTSWSSVTNANRAVGQVNLADSTSNDWYITGVQLEVGTFDSNSIPDFQFEDRATSLARCQRYYVRQEKQSTNQIVCVGMCTSTVNSFGEYYYPQVMRTIPTFSYSAIGDLQCVRTGGNTNPTSVVLQNASNIVGNIKSVVSSGFTAGQAMFLRFDTDAVSTPPQYIEFDSEL